MSAGTDAKYGVPNALVDPLSAKGNGYGNSSGYGYALNSAHSSNSTARGGPRALDADLCEVGLSGLGKSPDALAHAYLRLQLPGQNLSDVSLLSEYPHLQDVDLSDNALRDVSALCALPHLHRLNVSNNRISAFLDFRQPQPSPHPQSGRSASGGTAALGVSSSGGGNTGVSAAPTGPRALREVDCSYNGLTSISAELVARHKYLTTVNLRGNRLTTAALDALSAVAHNLHTLDVSANEITDLSPLALPPTPVPSLPAGSSGSGSGSGSAAAAGVRFAQLTDLNLSRNRLTSVACLKRGTLPRVRVLDLTANKLTATAGLQNLPTLTVLRLGENEIAELDEQLQPLTALQQLRELDLRSCKVTSADAYRLRTIHLLNRLSELDGAEVRSGEKVDAANSHGADHLQRAAVDAYYLPFGNHTTPAAFSAVTKEEHPLRVDDADSSSALAKRDPLAALVLSATGGVSASPKLQSRRVGAGTGTGTGAAARSGDNVTPRTPSAEDVKESDGSGATGVMQATAALSEEEYDDALKKLLRDKFERQNDERPRWSDAHFWLRMAEKGLVNEWKDFLRVLRAQAAAGSVKRIDLSNLAVGEVGLWAVARALEERPQLEQLTLNACLHAHSWTATLSNDFGLHSLATALTASALQYLRLDDCGIGRRGAHLLAGYVSVSRTLRLLSLANNRIGANVVKVLPDAVNGDARAVIQAAPALADLLAAVLQCPSLISLRLSGNGIDAHGAALMGAALLNPKCALRSLALGDNPLDALALHHLSQAVTGNRMLQMLEIRGGANGRCTGAAMLPLLKAIAKANDTISWLDLTGNTLHLPLPIFAAAPTTAAVGSDAAAAAAAAGSGAAPPAAGVADAKGPAPDAASVDPVAAAAAAALAAPRATSAATAAASVAGSDTSGDTAAQVGAALATLLKRDARLFPAVSSRIVHLVVANAGLNGKAITAIAGALQTNTALIHLDLSGNSRVDDASAARVLTAIARHPALRFCNLMSTGSGPAGLGPASAAALGKALENISLRMLHVGPKPTVHLSQQEAASIAAVDAAYANAPGWVARLNTPASADSASSPPFGASPSPSPSLFDGGLSIAKSLAARSVSKLSLQRLVLRGSCDLIGRSGSGGTAGSAALAAALSSAASSALFPALESLDLGGHEWSAEGWSSLCAAIGGLKALKELILSQTRLPVASRKDASVVTFTLADASHLPTGPGAVAAVASGSAPEIDGHSHAHGHGHVHSRQSVTHGKASLDGRGPAVCSVITSARAVACRAIDLSGTALGDDGAAGLAVALKDNGCVMSLLLSCCSLEPVDPTHSPTASISAAADPKLLSVTGSSVASAAVAPTAAGAAGAGAHGLNARRGLTALFEVLAGDKILRNLSLRSNNLSVASVSKLSGALKRNRALTMLDLTHNAFATYAEDVGRVVYELVSASPALHWLSLPSVLTFHSGGAHRMLHGTCVQCGRTAAGVAAAVSAATAAAKAAGKRKGGRKSARDAAAAAKQARARRLQRQAAKDKAAGAGAGSDDDDPERPGVVSDDDDGTGPGSGESGSDSGNDSAGDSGDDGDDTKADDAENSDDGMYDSAPAASAQRAGTAVSASAAASADGKAADAKASSATAPAAAIAAAAAAAAAAAVAGAAAGAPAPAAPSPAQTRQLLLCPNSNGLHHFVEGLCLLCGQAPVPSVDFSGGGSALPDALPADACVVCDERVALLRAKQRDHYTRMLATGLQKNSGSGGHLRSLFIGPLASALSTAQKKVLLSALTRSRLSLLGTHPAPTQPPVVPLVGGPVEPAFRSHAHGAGLHGAAEPPASSGAGSGASTAAAPAAGGGAAAAAALAGAGHAHDRQHHTHALHAYDPISTGWVEADADTQLAAVSHNALVARLAANRQSTAFS